MPVLLLIGDKDTTAIGKDVAPAEVREKLGHYPELGKTTAAAIKDARLVDSRIWAMLRKSRTRTLFTRRCWKGLAGVAASKMMRILVVWQRSGRVLRPRRLEAWTCASC